MCDKNKHFVSISLITILVILSPCIVFSNDTSFVGNLFNKMDFRVKGGIYYIMGSSGAPVEMPDYFVKSAEKADVYIPTHVTDNPLNHGAAFNDFTLTIKSHGFTIKPELIAEHRGQSYGVYNKNALVLIPKYYFAFDTNFSFWNDKLFLGVNTGNFDDLRMYEGLTIYNLDVQGTYLYLKWKYFKGWYRKIADLINGSGLHIDDLNSLGFKIDSINIFKSWNFEFNYGLDNYEFGELSMVNYSLAFYNPNFRLYTQLGYRYSDSAINSKWSSAFVSGINFKTEDEDYQLNCTAEYRYYDYYFNKGFINKNAIYRNRNAIYRNDGNIYPIMLYDRPFSQWAVFTEYQNKNVAAYILRINGKYFFYDKFNIFAVLDANYIRATNEEGFLYPFLTAGIKYEPVDKCDVSFGFTNKTMNLDKHYPTFYLINFMYPLFSLQFEF